MVRKIINRQFKLSLPSGKSAFLWGPRKVGKTYWLRHHLSVTDSDISPRQASVSGAVIIDLLKTDVFAEFASRPALLRERYQLHKGLIVIDEIQKIPALLDEVHWLIENKGISFLLTGSSARKLRRGHANLLGGRAWRRTMTPLSCVETEGFNLEDIMLSGLLPPHYLSADPIEEIRGYVADYLKDEIAGEALVRNIPSFSEFLRVAAVTSSELLNYTNVARETGVSPKVVRGYFDILEDTYLGFRVQPWRKAKNRRLIETEKFYMFDIGIANYLCRRCPKPGTPEFGKSFEHYILMELKAYQAYKNPELDISFWRTAGGFEVDFLMADKALALEAKASPRVHEGHTKGLVALTGDGPVKKSIIVCLEKEPRTLANGIEIAPWENFVRRLWSGEFF
ncbi:MAG: AAA family ATPase [Elusimicrobia bacterium]|nr:AAA family ATPase [Elusimicrobiota bacterium]